MSTFIMADLLNASQTYSPESSVDNLSTIKVPVKNIYLYIYVKPFFLIFYNYEKLV